MSILAIRQRREKYYEKLHHREMRDRILSTILRGSDPKWTTLEGYHTLTILRSKRSDPRKTNIPRIQRPVRTTFRGYHALGASNPKRLDHEEIIMPRKRYIERIILQGYSYPKESLPRTNYTSGVPHPQNVAFEKIRTQRDDTPQKQHPEETAFQGYHSLRTSHSRRSDPEPNNITRENTQDTTLKTKRSSSQEISSPCEPHFECIPEERQT